MKSLYQKRNFAEFWNIRTGNEGDPYKKYVLDNAMFKAMGSIKGKRLLEVGCGNGYLCKRFIKLGASQIYLMDISKYNLDYAKKKCKGKQIHFILQDATKPWKFPSNSVQIVYSSMMLNEVDNIKVAIKESFRVLKRKGTFIFSVTHPSWDLYIYAQQQLGVKSDKVVGVKSYFDRGYSKYIMGLDSKQNMALKKYKNKTYKVEHYHRPFSDYFNTLTDAGFVVKSVKEPELNKAILKAYPRFRGHEAHPTGLIFLCIKP